MFSAGKNRPFLFSSESVTEGHPDKIADQISDSVLDAILAQDPKARVACETLVNTGLALISGEITTTCYVHMPDIVRKTIEQIGYSDSSMGFDYKTCAVMTSIDRQSDDIKIGVTEGEGLYKEQGAGDQGMMFGYACTETPEFMPAALMYAHKLVEKLADIRKNHSELMPYLRPDAKAQVTIAYNDAGTIEGINTIVISTQHDPGVTQEHIASDIKQHVIPAVIPSEMISPETVFHINPTGKFEIGGPHGDTGLTGRKIIVDTYGGKAPHGGGAFSGKDPTKVDRSAAYAARYLAKNIVAAGLADQCTIQVSYAIGVKEPVSLLVDMHGTGTIASEVLSQFILKHIDLSPKGIIDRLQLQRPIYRASAAYGHFGRNEFPWEQLDLVSLFSSLS